MRVFKTGEKGTPEDDEVPPGLMSLFAGSLKQAAPYMDAVYGLVGAILGLGLLGWFLDRRYGTGPRWVLAGVFTGLAVGFYGLGRVMFGRR